MRIETIMQWFNTVVLLPRCIPTKNGDAIFDELVIDDQPLGEYLWPGQQNHIHISPFGRPGARGQILAAYTATQLLRKAPAPSASGRRPIYVCNECGDLGCGGVTAVIERQDTAIVWHDFGFETHDPADLQRIDPSPIFRFESSTYYALFAPFMTAKIP
jgi:hypothetical protein